MNLTDRLAALSELGSRYLAFSPADWAQLADRAIAENAWFAEPDLRQAVQAVATQYLAPDRLAQWLKHYPTAAHSSRPSKTIGVVLAGNIPLVGFHDILCIFVAGHRAQIKLSARDSVLIRHALSELRDIAPETADYFLTSERLQHFDAIIATGSNNSSRYFDYYFGKYPHIIRRNRSSIAVLSGNETEDDLLRLGSDVFSYSGLGCRNVSKLFVPANYDFSPLLHIWEPHYADMMLREKYKANYDYQRALLLLNREPHTASDFVMLRSYSEAVASPVSVLFYEQYTDTNTLHQRIGELNEQIQCIVGNPTHYAPAIPFGAAQTPQLNDYADGIDTMSFLLNI